MTNFRTKLLKAAALTKAHPSHPLQPCASNTGCQNINTWKTKRKLQSAELNSLANVCRVTTTVNFFINYNICWDNTIMKRYILVLCWYNLIRSFKVQECGFTVYHFPLLYLQRNCVQTFLRNISDFWGIGSTWEEVSNY